MARLLRNKGVSPIIKAAVIGMGDISVIHLASIEHSPGVQLVAVCDTQESARKRASAGVPFFTNYEKMICAFSEKPLAGLKRASEEFGVKISSLSASVEPMMPGMPGETLATDFDKIVGDCKTLSCDMLRIGMLPLTCMGNYEMIMDFARKADAMTKRLKEHGIDLYNHNHHVEFIKHDGKYLLDIIKESTEYLGFELDIHWIQRGGENPIEFIKKQAEFVCSI